MEKYFSGVVRDGEFLPHSYEQKTLDLRLAKLEGKQVKMLLTQEFGIRSNQQNKYLYAVPYKMIGDETGEDDLEIINSQMALMFIPEKIKVWDEETGKTIIAKIPGHVSGLNTVEFEEYAEKIRRWGASFLGLNIPLPNEVIPQTLEEN